MKHGVQITRTYFPNNHLQTFFRGQSTTSKSPLPSSETRFELLYKQALNRPKRHEQLQQKDKSRLKMQCTFSPLINQPKIDYEVGVVQRNELWVQQKAKRLLEVEQEETLRKLKHCTFSPHIQSKANEYYLREREKRQTRRKQQDKAKKLQQQGRHKPKMGYEDAKKNLQYRINTLQI